MDKIENLVNCCLKGSNDSFVPEKSFKVKRNKNLITVEPRSERGTPIFIHSKHLRTHGFKKNFK